MPVALFLVFVSDLLPSKLRGLWARAECAAGAPCEANDVGCCPCVELRQEQQNSIARLGSCFSDSVKLARVFSFHEPATLSGARSVNHTPGRQGDVRELPFRLRTEGLLLFGSLGCLAELCQGENFLADRPDIGDPDVKAQRDPKSK